jgi:hypothetical protein
MDFGVKNLPEDIKRHIGKFLTLHERRGIPLLFGRKLVKLLEYPRCHRTMEQKRRISYYNHTRLSNQVPGFRFRRITPVLPPVASLALEGNERFFFRRSTLPVQYYLRIRVVDFFQGHEYYIINMTMHSQWNDTIPPCILENLDYIVEGYEEILGTTVLGLNRYPPMVEFFWSTGSTAQEEGNFHFQYLSKSSILYRMSRFVEHITKRMGYL